MKTFTRHDGFERERRCGVEATRLEWPEWLRSSSRKVGRRCHRAFADQALVSSRGRGLAGRQSAIVTMAGGGSSGDGWRGVRCRGLGAHATKRGGMVGRLRCGSGCSAERLAGARYDARSTKPRGCGCGFHVLGDVEDRCGDRDVGDRVESGAGPELASAAGHDGSLHQGQLARAVVARPTYCQEGVATRWQQSQQQVWQARAQRMPRPQANTSFITCSTCRTSRCMARPTSRSSTGTRRSSAS